MTTTISPPHGFTQPATSTLAVHGGPRAVARPARDRWRHVHLRDAIPIVKHILKGQATSFSPRGPVGEFERAFAKLTDTRFALAMNSGTSALHSALFAVGVGADDEVIVPTYTFHASASAVRCCGATPVFCDIDPRTLTADPQDVAQRVTPKTKAIMVVHVAGNPCRMETIREIADEHGVAVVEDCSHAHGASYRGKPVGSWGEVGCFSLQGEKAVSAGEGGVAVCSNPKYYDRMLALAHPLRVASDLEVRSFDIGAMQLGPKYRPHLFGVLLAISSLKRLPELNRLRRRNWDILCEELAGCEAISPAETLPGAKRGGFLAYIFILNKQLKDYHDFFIKAAQAEGVPVAPDGYGLLHEAPVFRTEGPLHADFLDSLPRPCGPVIELPNARGLDRRRVLMRALAKVPEAYLRQCGQGLRKVAEHLQRQAVARAQPDATFDRCYSDS